MYSQQDLLAFQALMKGASDFYGTTVVGEIKDGKAQSSSTCVHETPSPSLFSRHLAGQISIGISPLKADDTLEFGAIDIDDYNSDLMTVVRAIWDLDMPICPCFSKSKKLHLYFFFTMGTKAADAIEVMRWYARAFACNKKVEIFPKQTERSLRNKAYSWINIPYFNANDESNHRKLVKADGSFGDVGEFIERALAAKWDIAEHKDKITKYPCYDAPPCILTGAILRDIGAGGRNNWLFSAAVYFKLKDENCDLEEKLSELNSSLFDPISDEELHSTILSSLQRKSYFYLCSTLDRCDKHLCQGLEYGVSSTKSTGLEFGQLTQVMTDPPTYEWAVNGQKLTFKSEAELLQQTQFRCLSLRQLHIVPRPVSEADWSKLVNKACKSIAVVTPEGLGNDFSVGAQFFDLVCSFFNDQRRATNITQIHLGRVYLDENTREYVFTAHSLVNFVTEVHKFKGLSQLEMRQRLVDMGAVKAGNMWRLPSSAIPASDKPNVEVDLNLHEGESNDF